MSSNLNDCLLELIVNMSVLLLQRPSRIWPSASELKTTKMINIGVVEGDAISRWPRGLGHLEESWRLCFVLKGIKDY